tara:strand:+ start:555 stop:1010 length:456 start_codon:yes stop_codon:yes gene_type:complete
LVKIQSRQSKQKLEDVKLLANENDEGNEIDDAETTKKSKKRRKIGNSGLNEDDLLEYDMNMLLDRDDPRRGADENLDTMSNMSEFNAAPSGSRAVSGGNNQFYLRDEEVLQWAKTPAIATTTMLSFRSTSPTSVYNSKRAERRSLIWTTKT